MRYTALFLVLGFFSLLILAPVLKGYSISDENKKFSGVTGLYNQETFYYLALGPSQITDGEILLKDKFGRAPDMSLFINPIANIISIISGVFDLSIMDAFTVFRILAAIFLLLSFFHLSGNFISSFSLRLFALLLYGSSAGFQSWWNVPGVDPWDDSCPEMNMFISMMGEYYLPLANGLLLITLSLTWQTLTGKGNTPLLLVSGLILMLLGAVYIYGMLVGILLISALCLFLIYTHKNHSRIILRKSIVILLFALPILIYYGWVFSILNDAAKDEDWFKGPTLIETILTYGSTIVPAMLFLISQRRKIQYPGIIALTGWIFFILVLTRIPPPYLPFQIQSFIGINAPLTILAVLGWQYITEKIPARFMAVRGITLSIILVLSSLTNIAFYKKNWEQIESKEFPEFIPSREMLALDWIRENISKEAKFLVSPENARVLAGFTGSNVYYSIGPEEELRSSNEVKVFSGINRLSKQEKKEEIKKLLTDMDISHIFLDPSLADKYLNRETIALLTSSFTTIYSGRDITILQVQK